MAIYKDEKRNSWYFAVNYDDFGGNRRQKRQRGFRTKREATQAQHEFLRELKNGVVLQNDATISEIIDIYLKDKQRIVKGSTYKSLFGILNGRVRYCLGNVKISELKNTHILYLHEFMYNPPAGSKFKKISFSTSREIHSVFIAMLKYAEKHYEAPPVAHKFTPPKARDISAVDTGKLKYYTLEQFETLVAAMYANGDKFVADIVSILYYTGMRIGELLAITYKHVDFDAKKILVRQNVITVMHNGDYVEIISTPKTLTSVRDISLPDRALSILKEYFEEDSEKENFDESWFIFSLAKFEHFSYSLMRHRYNAAFARTGMPRIKMHDFRHSHASLLINAGADALLLKERLGHASVTTTLDTYAHFFPEKEDEILAKLNILLPQSCHD
ncbi:MAG: site-specific integrase [Culicoidibacterales bacterium]